MASTPEQMMHGGTATKMVAVTPDDSNDLAVPARGIYIGGAGNVNGILRDDSSPVVLTALAVGVAHPFAFKRIYSTSTTATNIVVMY